MALPPTTMSAPHATAPAPTQEAPFWVQSEDWHTGGEPFRIVTTDSLPASITSFLPANVPVPTLRNHILSTTHHPLDTLRKTLCHEPRGHADMYGGFVLPPQNGAHLGVLFWHKDGFSTACGHGTIALGCWALANGVVAMPTGGTGIVDVHIDVPSGRVLAQLDVQAGKVRHVDFVNVASYQVEKGLDVEISLPRPASLKVDLSFGGAPYATLPASAVGLLVERSKHDEFVAYGRAIKAALGARGRVGDYDLYGVIFYDELDPALLGPAGKDVVYQRNVTVFADGEIDRSPCGSGTAARVAVLLAEGKLAPTTSDFTDDNALVTAPTSRVPKTLVHDSIVDTRFTAAIARLTPSPTQFPGCIPRVRGMAHLTGQHRFWIDVQDPVYPGFVFR